ncbi:MAG: hypothetical protein RLZZ546_2879 [Bacteroidota bacterium]
MWVNFCVLFSNNLYFYVTFDKEKDYIKIIIEKNLKIN